METNGRTGVNLIGSTLCKYVCPIAREYRAASEIRWTAIDSKARRNAKIEVYFFFYYLNAVNCVHCFATRELRIVVMSVGCRGSWENHHDWNVTSSLIIETTVKQHGIYKSKRRRR